MSNNLGSGSVTLSANATGLHAGLKESGAKIEDFAKSTQRTLGERLSGGMAGIGKRVGGGLVGGLTGAVKGNVSGIGSHIGDAFSGALALAGKGVHGAVAAFSVGAASESVHAIKDLAKVGNMAHGLGVDNAQFQGMGMALKKVGMGTDELAGSFAKLGKNVQHAALDGTGPAANALNKLGLSASELAKLPVDQQMLRISTAMKQAGAGTATTAASMELFGKQATACCPCCCKAAKRFRRLLTSRSCWATP